MGRLASTLVGLAALAAGAAACEQARSRPGDRSALPNVVLVCADDLGWGDLACQGNGYFETPRIDAFMAQGVRFTQAYSDSALCCPSRVALLSGRASARVGCYEVVEGLYEQGADLDEVDFVPPANRLQLPPEPILAEYLEQAGYATAFFGKWHVGTREGPGERGFQEYVGVQTNVPRFHAEEHSFQRRGDYPDPRGFTEDYLVDCSLRFIDRAGAKPFFVYLAYTLVHLPLEADPDLIRKYESKPATRFHRNATYAAMVETLDTSFGELLDGLSARGLREETLVVFTSDNGALTGCVSKRADPIPVGLNTTNSPLRGGKCQLWEGGIRVPLGVVYGEKLRAGAVVDTPVAQLDLLPTLLDLIGHPRMPADQEQLDGVSLRGLLEGDGPPLAERALYWHYPGYRGLSPDEPVPEGLASGAEQRPAGAIRRGSWKLIESLETGAVQLYDLAADVSESTDLAAAHPEVAGALAAELAAWRERVGAPALRRK